MSIQTLHIQTLVVVMPGWLSMAFGNRQWLRVHHTKPSTLGWSTISKSPGLVVIPIHKWLLCIQAFLIPH